MTALRQTRIGLGLAAAIWAAWAALHLWSVFRQPLHGRALLAAPLLVTGLCWLNVGLFIVAHDAMHRSLAPGRARLNRWAGRIALACYAGLSFDRLLPKHRAHHRNPGTSADPDFSPPHPSHFWPWYADFFARYFGVRELAVIGGLILFYLVALGASPARLLVFWALPALLSSLQLFLFGTFLPHRVESAPFADEHRARSSGFGWWTSLLTCFHFGYHREHHLSPGTPWWRLPQARIRAAPPR